MPKFLDATCTPDLRVHITSFPRSGNSQMRKYIENVTGIFTGTASPLQYHCISNLQLYGFFGEGIIDNKIFFEKTHYPARCNQAVLKTNRVLVLARNFIDVCVSHYNFIQTHSHDLSIKQEFHVTNADQWKEFVEREILI